MRDADWCGMLRRVGVRRLGELLPKSLRRTCRRRDDSMPRSVADAMRGSPVHTPINKVFSDPRYYLYGVLIVIAAFILLFLFGIQTGTSSGGGPR